MIVSSLVINIPAKSAIPQGVSNQYLVMPRPILLANHRWRRPWPLVLRDLQDAGLSAKVSLPSRRIFIETRAHKNREIADAVRRARRGPHRAPGVLLPTAATIVLTAVFVVFTASGPHPQPETAQATRQGISCQASMVQTIAQSASQTRESELGRWLPSLNQGLPEPLDVSILSYENLGGYAKVSLGVERPDCQATRVTIELSRSQEFWEVKKITRQPGLTGD